MNKYNFVTIKARVFSLKNPNNFYVRAEYLFNTNNWKHSLRYNIIDSFRFMKSPEYHMRTFTAFYDFKTYFERFEFP